MTESISEQIARVESMAASSAIKWTLDHCDRVAIAEVLEQRRQLLAALKGLLQHGGTNEDEWAPEFAVEAALAAIRRAEATEPVPSTTGRNESTAGKRP